MSLRVEVAIRVTENSGLTVAEAGKTTMLTAPNDTSLQEDLGEAGAALSQIVDQVREDALGQIAAMARAVTTGA